MNVRMKGRQHVWRNWTLFFPQIQIASESHWDCCMLYVRATCIPTTLLLLTAPVLQCTFWILHLPDQLFNLYVSVISSRRLPAHMVSAASSVVTCRCPRGVMWSFLEMPLTKPPLTTLAPFFAQPTQGMSPVSYIVVFPSSSVMVPMLRIVPAAWMIRVFVVMAFPVPFFVCTHFPKYLCGASSADENIPPIVGVCRVLFVLVVAVHSAVFVANVACYICIPGIVAGYFQGVFNFQATFGPKINIFFSPITY